jgi:cytochrome c peroxidase
MRGLFVLLMLVGLLGLVTGFALPETRQKGGMLPFSPDEVAAAASLRLKPGMKAPADQSNRYADNPQAAAFGQKLFFDARLSSNGKVACTSCHKPDEGFADPGLVHSVGIGKTKRNAPSIVGSAFSRWYFWDGRRDSQWAQALTPMLDGAEHGLTRTSLARRIFDYHRPEYESIFGPLPGMARLPSEAGPEGNAQAVSAWSRMSEQDRDSVNRVLANTGKAIAAYERTVLHQPARFDRFAEALVSGRPEEAARIFSTDERQGFRLFIGSARCVQCHNGPNFSNFEFHSTGLHPADAPIHMGHQLGVQQARENDFTCMGRYSDGTQTCPHRFSIPLQNMVPGTFKTASLRNVALTAPYMHTGEFATLDELVEHYDSGGRSRGREIVWSNELNRLFLTQTELRQLKAFLLTLTAENPRQTGSREKVATQ